MKWYFAINETGTETDVGLHAKIAVLSARKNTTLEPVLLTTGFENDFTAWMREHGVHVVPHELTFADDIRAAAARGVYRLDYMGHWLRSEICLIEHDDPFVLYTDCDVVFLRDPDVAQVKPALFACAPEFRKDGWNYINTGAMVMNLGSLRAVADEFRAFIVQKIASGEGQNFRDQYAHNLFFRRRWEKLDLRLNWKPYWGTDPETSILHFHGPKLGAIRAIADGSWNWGDEHGTQIGSLVAAFQADYALAVRSLLTAIEGEPLAERGYIEAIARDLEKPIPSIPRERVSTAFMDFRLFPDA